MAGILHNNAFVNISTDTSAEQCVETPSYTFNGVTHPKAVANALRCPKKAALDKFSYLAPVEDELNSRMSEDYNILTELGTETRKQQEQYVIRAHASSNCSPLPTPDQKDVI